MFAGIIFAGNVMLLKEEIEKDATTTAFCCVGNGEEVTLCQAGEEKEELAKKKKE